MSMCRVFFCVDERGCLLWPVYSLGKTFSLCPATFCSPGPNLPVTPTVSWLPTFAFQSPMMKMSLKFYYFIFKILLLKYNCFMILSVSAVQQSESAICIHLRACYSSINLILPDEFSCLFSSYCGSFLPFLVCLIFIITWFWVLLSAFLHLLAWLLLFLFSSLI